MDQLESTTPGRPLTYSGHVDHISHKFFVEFQHSTSCDETIKGKIRMEADAKECAIEITSFHADNGVFKEREFRKHLENLVKLLPSVV